MNDELLERIGRLIDTCDNLLAAAALPLPASIHVTGLKSGVKDIRAELFAIHTDAGGEDVWGGSDGE